MEQFIVSARKYRPQNFSTVVGQSHITTTLKNAIRNQQLAHAFLFCGPRGVGKTTCARILAKTINCEHPGADGEACNTCQSCVSFNEGSSLNIHELDAASNNSVDDIRSLVEQVRFAPQAGKYKVYIVDEVHMLSTSAFNAFLKTLEEPPPYAIFILATTEKHKILPTILSRCQIFDFKRITTNDTVEHLEEICEKESIHADKAALQVIAQKSEGCMRDALSILDKIVSFTNGELSYQNTLEHLNILDADYYFRMMDCMLKQDLAGAMLLYEDINRKGFEGDLVLNGFADFIRNLLLSKDAKVAVLVDVVESFRNRYVEMASQLSAGYLVSALNVLAEAEINYKGARNKRLHVELALIKLCYLQQAIELVSDTGKKKLTETRPMNFRVLQPIAHPESLQQLSGSDRMPPAGQVGLAPKPQQPNQPQQPLHQPLHQSLPQPLPQPPAPPAPSASPAKTKGPVLMIEENIVTGKAKPSTPKLGSLEKLRQQVSSSAQNSTVIPTIFLTDEVLKLAWQEFVEQLKANRNPAAQSFELAELRVVDRQTFTVVTPNNLQQKFIDSERIPLSEFMQQRFHNRYLTFSVIVEQRDDFTMSVEIPLNSKERFQQMVEQYPLVKELKDRLKLELDY
ncbi:DNA polymerase III subunit gamma/tau [Flavihumibacter stibioxidans]|uniref:DNA polymerase III subunit gamma/tau n=1 Tax=Flavihumibacter stibioxidans TaxID=1834163 RepID=A0ABR7M804_9BACT|nr:DNA polymerase III subunit gamma/tau [Flavihumibacter stibioxidans]MBC6490763.1 DNA polymerase III, subunit gamma and tau [Flavihumibacter stibioxidans]